MKTKKIFNFLLLLGFLSGCDYLDIVPDNLPTLEMAFNNKSSAERFLFTCYSFVPEHGKIGTDPGMDVGDEVWYYSDIDDWNWFNFICCYDSTYGVKTNVVI